jgi:hypothetical protein
MRISSQTWGKFRELLRETAPSQEQMAARLRTVEKDVMLPVKGVFVAILLYYLYFSRWFEDIALPRPIAQQYVGRFFLLYLLVNIIVSVLLLRSSRLSMGSLQRVIFLSNFLDSLMVAALTFITWGFDSTLYWVFLV